MLLSIGFHLESELHLRNILLTDKTFQQLTLPQHLLLGVYGSDSELYRDFRTKFWRQDSLSLYDKIHHTHHTQKHRIINTYVYGKFQIPWNLGSSSQRLHHWARIGSPYRKTDSVLNQWNDRHTTIQFNI